MARRAIAVGALSLLASCEFFYGVAHRADGPFAFDPVAVQEALRAEPGAEVERAWDGRTLVWSVGRGISHATVCCEVPQPARGVALSMESTWVGTVPADEDLRAAIVLQRDVLTALARAVPGFPPADAFGVQWIGLDNPCGAELAAAMARWEAAQRRDPSP